MKENIGYIFAVADANRNQDVNSNIVAFLLLQ